MKTLHSSKNDKELLEIYRRNEKLEIFSGLYGRYIPLIYGISLKYLNDSVEAQRVVMQLFELVKGEVLKQEIENFRPWLYRYVRNYCLIRAGREQLEAEDDRMDFCDDFDPGKIETEETKKVLLKCIEGLPEKQRIGIYRFFLEERSYREIEDATGFSLKSVKYLIRLGKNNLKACLAKKGIL